MPLTAGSAQQASCSIRVARVSIVRLGLRWVSAHLALVLLAPGLDPEEVTIQKKKAIDETAVQPVEPIMQSLGCTHIKGHTMHGCRLLTVSYSGQTMVLWQDTFTASHTYHYQLQMYHIPTLNPAGINLIPPGTVSRIDPGLLGIFRPLSNRAQSFICI